MNAPTEVAVAREATFAHTGSLIHVGNDSPFLLRGDQAWLVETGRLDVFAVPVDGQRIVGGRQHLFRAEAGRLLVGLPGNQTGRHVGLLAVGAPGTQVRPVSRERLDELVRDPDRGQLVHALLDDWIDILCMSLSGGVPTEEGQEIRAGETVDAPPGARFRPRRGVVWVKHDSGESLLLGESELEINGFGYMPISRRAWIEPQSDSSLRVADTRSLPGDGELWNGLDELHRLLLRRTRTLDAQRSDAERERLTQRSQTRDHVFREACTRLAHTLGTPSQQLPEEQDTGLDPLAGTDPLLAACRLVGQAADITIQAPPARGAPPRDPLAAIARASRIRTRQVLLRHGWWKQDGGPFVATLLETDQPVALLPVSANAYALHDPETGKQTPVTEEIAARVDPRAHMLYRPFPEKKLGIRDVITFGLSASRRDTLMVLLMAVVTGLLGLVTPLATGKIFNDIIPAAERSGLMQMCFGLVVIAVATAVFELLRAIALVRIEGRMGTLTQSAVWDRLLALPTAFFRTFTAGDLATRAMGIDGIRQVLSAATVRALLGSIFAGFQFLLLFHYNVRLALWSALLIAIAIAIAGLTSRFQMNSERIVASIRTRLAGTVLQFLSSISKLKVAGAEPQAFAIWARSFGHQRRVQLRVRTIANVLAAFNAGYPTATFAVLYAMALPLLGEADGFRTGDFLAFMAAYTTCLNGMLAATGALASTLTAIPLYEQAQPILHGLPEVRTDKADPGELTGSVEIQHVRFRYHPDGPWVLNDMSVEVRPGEYVAFVGPSGSGKSTALRLLLGFEEPESGAIYYDGQDLSGLDASAVRGQIGVVLQNGRLMAGDIFTNIAGSSNATLDEAWNAAEMAGLAADIRAMPMGMHTMVTDGGGTLSGGQRQRLMIARAIVGRPRLVYLDEATSALDNRTQATVRESLDRLQATRIVVAHRLSTVEHADRIYVIERGAVVEVGDFDELMARDGLFATLARRQMA
ncbi:MAG: NHLP bacteriocin export ABC transporter permease/ATPase subunit [Gammaproteobacteria bacterium]|nr:NHLP bacteriocin export ABC transporter permease/ATPase subunit [Gammaproteobacteria bacterium]MYF61270.1 NHLP bacteriocin export ABC transporter permease/ATPase subunit [Gammaproteobacteria bacterium]MYJ39943.1 NHLP bacteriocin export ABC transporter permease/ATPase subunit [Gemmatimonadota bacterium]